VLDLVDAFDERRARLDRNLLLRDHFAAVEAFVDIVDGDAGARDARGERVVDRMRSGEGGKERRVHVHDPVREAVEERRRQHVHVAGQHDELDVVLLEPRRHDEVSLLPRRVAVEGEGRGGDPCGASTLERPGVAAVRGDAGDRQLRVDQRLQVGSFARDEDADHVLSIRPMTRSPSAGSGTIAQ